MFNGKWLIGMTTVAALAAASVLWAQAPAPGSRPARGERARQFLLTYLGLTDSQKTQAKGIFDAARAQAAPIAAQLNQGRTALRDAVKAGKPDTELDALATQQGALMGQLAAIRAKALAKMYPMLTPEQKDKLDQLRGFVRGRFGHGP